MWVLISVECVGHKVRSSNITFPILFSFIGQMSWQPPYHSSKFRHVFAKPASRENCYTGLPITCSVHDNAFCAVNPRFIAVVTECAGGGAFLIISIYHVRPYTHTQSQTHRPFQLAWDFASVGKKKFTGSYRASLVPLPWGGESWEFGRVQRSGDWMKGDSEVTGTSLSSLLLLPRPLSLNLFPNLPQHGSNTQITSLGPPFAASAHHIRSLLRMRALCRSINADVLNLRALCLINLQILPSW